ncbi:hypothetical protein R1flu_021769 [Riccia fluitans]|uniref:Uncharacterized protein n=1 Tax=Riccia fluitans TaxID=41844 RepID=A0ABD1ZQB3_9MARC
MAEWVEKGETCSKYFFATLKSKQAQEWMTYLWDEEDREIRDEEKILEYVYKYYAELYAQPAIFQADKREQENTLTLVDQLVSEEDNL